MELIPQYVNQNEYFFDKAQASEVWNNDVYQNLPDDEKNNYLKLAATFDDNKSSQFNYDMYTTLTDPQDKYAYLIHSNFGKAGTQDYNNNQEYFDAKYDYAKAKEAYNQLDFGQKVINNVGGVLLNVGSAFLDMFEGVLDIATTVEQGVLSISDRLRGDTEAAEATEAATMEEWRKSSIKDALFDDAESFEKSKNEWLMWNTTLDHGIGKVLNDIAVNVSKRVIMKIPVVGQATYYGSMVGNSLAEASKNNANITFNNALAYAGLVFATEFATDKTMDSFFKGKGLLNKYAIVSKGKTWIGRTMLDLGLTFTIEGMEESVSELIDGMLYRAYIDPKHETSMQDVLYAGLIGGLTAIIGEGIGILKADDVDTKSGKKLHKIDKLILANLGTDFSKTLDKGSAVMSLMYKYNLSEADLRTQKTDEYNKAVLKDRQQNKNVVKAYMTLNKFLSQISPEDAAKASDLYNKSIEQIANYARAQAAYSDQTFNEMQKLTIERYNRNTTDGSHFVPLTELNPQQFQFIDQVRKAFKGMNIVLGNVTGDTLWNGCVTYENTIFINADILSTTAPTDIIKNVVAHEVVHALQLNNNVLSKADMDVLDKTMRNLGYNIDYDAISVSEQYIGNDKDGLATRAEKQAHYYASALISDTEVINTVFNQRKNLFDKVYSWMYKASTLYAKNRLGYVEAQSRYSLLQNAMREYRLTIANNCGNEQSIDASIAALGVPVTPEQRDEMIALYDARRPDRHFVFVATDENFLTSQKRKLYNALLDQRKFTTEPIDISKIGDADYYNDDFVNNILNNYIHPYYIGSQGLRNVENLFKRSEVSDTDLSITASWFYTSPEEYKTQSVENPNAYYRNLVWRTALNNYLKEFNLIFDYESSCLVRRFDLVKYFKKNILNYFDKIDTTKNRPDFITAIDYMAEVNKIRTVADLFDNSVSQEIDLNILKQIPVKIVPAVDNAYGSILGSYNLTTKTVELSSRFLREGVYIENDQPIGNAVDVLSHEIQHALADIYNLYQGASPNEMEDAINKLNPNDLNRLKIDLQKLFDNGTPTVKDLATLFYEQDAGEILANSTKNNEWGSYDSNTSKIYRRVVLGDNGQLNVEYRGTGVFAVINKYHLQNDYDNFRRDGKYTNFDVATDIKTLTNNGYKTTEALLKQFKNDLNTGTFEDAYDNMMALVNANQKIAEYYLDKKQAKKLYDQQTKRLWEIVDNLPINTKKLTSEGYLSTKEIYAKYKKIAKEKSESEAYSQLQKMLAKNIEIVSKYYGKVRADDIVGKQTSQLSNAIDIRTSFKGIGSSVFDVEGTENKESANIAEEVSSNPEDIMDAATINFLKTVKESSVKDAIKEAAKTSDLDVERYRKDLAERTKEIGREAALKEINEKAQAGEYNKSGKYSVKGLMNAYDLLKENVTQLSQKELDDGVDIINRALTKLGKNEVEVLTAQEGYVKGGVGLQADQITKQDVMDALEKKYKNKELSQEEKNTIYNTYIGKGKATNTPEIKEAIDAFLEEKGGIQRKQVIKKRIATLLKNHPETADILTSNDNISVADGKIYYSDITADDLLKVESDMRDSIGKASNQKVSEIIQKLDTPKQSIEQQKTDVKDAQEVLDTQNVSRETEQKLEQAVQKTVNETVNTEINKTGKISKETKKAFNKATDSKYYNKASEVESTNKKIVDSNLSDGEVKSRDKISTPAKNTLDIDYVDDNGQKLYRKVNQQHLTEAEYAQAYPERMFTEQFKKNIKNLSPDQLVPLIKEILTNKNNLDTRENLNAKRALKYVYEHRAELNLSDADVDNLKDLYTNVVRESAYTLSETYAPGSSTKTTTEIIQESTGNKSYKPSQEVIDDITQDIDVEGLNDTVSKLQQELADTKTKYETQLTELNRKLSEATDKQSKLSLENKIGQVEDIRNDDIMSISKKLYYYKRLQDALNRKDAAGIVNALTDIAKEGIDNGGVADTKAMSTIMTKLIRDAAKQSVKRKWSDMTSAERTTALQNVVSKIRGYRYFAMLSSPSTWIKNYVGNSIMKGLDAITTKLDTYMENKLVKSENQLRLYSNQTISPEVVEFVSGMSDQIEVWSKGNRYDDTLFNMSEEDIAELSKSNLNSDLFKSKILNTYNNFVKEMLNDADEFSVQYAITKNIQQVFQANLDWIRSQTLIEAKAKYGIKDVDKLKEYLKSKSDARIESQSKTNPEGDLYNALFGKDTKALLNYMSDTTKKVLTGEAVTRGLQTYFKNANSISRMYNKMCKDNKALAFVFGITSPFIKVQTNMMTTFFKYSPFGWFNVLSKGLKLKGAKEAGDVFAEAKFSRSISEATIGSAGFVAGALLAALGKSIGVGIEYDKENYAGLTLKLGDFKIGLGDVTPFNGALSLGIAATEMFNDFPEALTTFSNVIYDYTLLGNLNDIAEYNQNAMDFVGSTIENWFGQYIPAILRNFARVVDPTKKKKSTNKVLHLLETLASNIPGLSYLVPSKVNPYTGDKSYRSVSYQGNSGIVAGAIEAVNQITGFKFMFQKGSEVQKEAERVGATTEGFNGKMTINGQTYTTSDPKYAAARAEYINKEVTKLIKTTSYKNMTDAEKKSAIQTIYRNGTELAKIIYWTDQKHTRVFTSSESYAKFKEYLDKNAKIKQIYKGYKGSKYM